MSTPLESYYKCLKLQYPDSLILFRIDDFYESFEDDALLLSEVLGIVLAVRSDRITPIAGFNSIFFEDYLKRLIGAGMKVTICEINN